MNTGYIIPTLEQKELALGCIEATASFQQRVAIDEVVTGWRHQHPIHPEYIQIVLRKAIKNGLIDQSSTESTDEIIPKSELEAQRFEINRQNDLI